MKRENKYFIIQLALILLCSCISRENKMVYFVNDFNKNYAPKFSSPIYKKWHSYLKDKNTIGIDITSEMINSTFATELLINGENDIVEEIIARNSKIAELIENKVSFEINFKDENNKILQSETVNYTNIKYRISKINEIKKERTSEDAMKREIATLKKSLPITVNSTGIIIKDVYTLDKGVVYEAEVPDLIAERMKKPEIQLQSKKSMLSNSTAKEMFINLINMGFKKIIYSYCDKKGKPVTVITIYDFDLK